MAGNSRKDLVLQWKNLFKLLPTLKSQPQKREGDGGKHGKIVCVLVSGNKWASVGHTQLMWVTLHFWSERRQKICISFTGSMIFFLTQLYGKSILVWSQQQQQAWLLCSLASSLTALYCSVARPSSAQCCSGAASSLFCFRNVGRSGRKNQVCSSWGLLSPDASQFPS